MIGMHVSSADNTFAINEESSRHRQFPCVVTIESLEVDTKTKVYFLELFRHSKEQVKSIRNFVILICQYGKG